ncbi:MAG: hypothetical protein MSA89_03160 [Clostridium sp.]|nr:hypothetical protein [Clostridium sp.]MCI7442077.1 hypothetical protein [Clostridium sp.]
MNKKLIKDIIKLKKMEYEIFKELMPECITNKIEKVEKEVLSLGTDIVLDLIKDNKYETKENKEVKKVGVDFK